MSIKIFTGLGELAGKVSSTQEKPVIGKLNLPSVVSDLAGPRFDSDAVDTELAPVAKPTTGTPQIPQHVFPSHPTSTRPGPQVLSRPSAAAPYETLFHEFDFEAIPFYNFWTDDEEDHAEQRGERKLDEIPRFIKLVWRQAPDLPQLMGVV